MQGEMISVQSNVEMKCSLIVIHETTLTLNVCGLMCEHDGDDSDGPLLSMELTFSMYVYAFARSVYDNKDIIIYFLLYHSSQWATMV